MFSEGIEEVQPTLGECWGDSYFSEEKGRSCRHRSISDLGLCLLHYVDYIGRMPDGYTELDVEREKQARKKALRLAKRAERAAWRVARKAAARRL